LVIGESPGCCEERTVTDRAPGVKAVILDLYGTLVYEPGFEGIFPTLAEIIGVDLPDYVAARQHTVTDAMVGRISSPEARARSMLAHLGLPVANGLSLRLAGLERDYRWPKVRLYPTTVPTLLALRERGLPIGLVSDCTSLMGWPILERLDLLPHFNAVALSYEVGHAKPAPEIYRTVLDRIGIRLSDCLFVGDGGSDELAGARSLGMTTVRIDQVGAFARTHHPGPSDYVIVSLDELLDLPPLAPYRQPPLALDVDWVALDLAVGSRIDPNNVPRIRAMGIDAVVDLRAEESDDPNLLRQHGLSFLHLPITDCDPLTHDQMHEGSNWIARERREGRTVLVHCQHGRGRSVVLLAAVLIDEGLSATAAIERIRSRRPQVALSASQLSAIYDYGQLVRE
jgi:putative hydrolase of the HAD superfamily